MRADTVALQVYITVTKGGGVYPSLRVGYLMNGKYLGAASQISEHSLNDLTQLLQAKFSRSSNVNLTALLE